LDKLKFCPNNECKLHNKQLKPYTWYDRYGTYKTKVFGRVQRYKCRRCGHTFSDQTYSIDYYAKRVIDYEELLKKIISTSSNRDISRDFSISTGTVSNKISRLSRQAIAVHEELKKKIVLTDSLSADGFESYSVSQYFPNNINFLVLSSSQYVYYLNYITIRRKGRMTENQKIKRKMLENVYKPSSKGIEISFLYLLYEIENMNKGKGDIYLYTDEKKEYERALMRHPYGYVGLKHIKTSSKKMRNYQNKLFSNNYLDRQIRKDLSNHVRETVCFARNVNNSMERMLIYIMYHNYMKIFREKERGRENRTHAEVAGIKRIFIDKSLENIFSKRRFLLLEKISDSFEEVWNRTLITPLKKNKEYLPAYAVA
jgi:transposase-like protein